MVDIIGPVDVAGDQHNHFSGDAVKPSQNADVFAKSKAEAVDATIVSETIAPAATTAPAAANEAATAAPKPKVDGKWVDGKFVAEANPAAAVEPVAAAKPKVQGKWVDGKFVAEATPASAAPAPGLGRAEAANDTVKTSTGSAKAPAPGTGTPAPSAGAPTPASAPEAPPAPAPTGTAPTPEAPPASAPAVDAAATDAAKPGFFATMANNTKANYADGKFNPFSSKLSGAGQRAFAFGRVAFVGAGTAAIADATFRSKTRDGEDRSALGRMTEAALGVGAIAGGLALRGR